MTEIDRNCVSLGLGQRNSGTRERTNIENRGTRGIRGKRETGRTREKVKQGVHARKGNRGRRGTR